MFLDKKSVDEMSINKMSVDEISLDVMACCRTIDLDKKNMRLLMFARFFKFFFQIQKYNFILALQLWLERHDDEITSHPPVGSR